ncbi:flagellar biosynthesis chaperone [Kurthia sp. 3B1D]|uniref:Flagellar FliJ protein n=2 Tax=Kurthia TaxID=1649 RepID=A0A433RT57_9BACL|nr:flagellar export protein FliJ [Kurthia sp. 3B1D]RUS55347.1 flagellar biosynthesis chaperone [Kurthia sp. 3B1D]
MPKYKYRFDSIIVVKEQEKNEVEMAYKKAVQDFEAVAQNLYDSLKRKEDLISYQEQQMKIGMSIQEMHSNAQFLDSIEKAIVDIQNKVIQARSKMEWFEGKLLEQTLECRKYEKMREKDYELFKLEKNRLEMLQLDELSQIAYYNKEIR